MERASEQIQERACLRAFLNSKYEEGKDRNPMRVPGTCQWILQHSKFIKWREDEMGNNLIWITADPGAGKSVLCKALVDEGLATSHTNGSTVCYFFFVHYHEDDSSVTKALSALLHQLFRAKRELIKYALVEFENYGYQISEHFEVMWKILGRAAADPQAGEVICILDALDECETAGRDMLIDSLVRYYSSRAESNSKMKFLISSRPYYDIERRFRTLAETMPTIRLAGESETDKLQREIDLVIKQRVSELGHHMQLRTETVEIIKQKLLETPNRTYLWLVLILDEIAVTSGRTSERHLMERLFEQPHTTISSAYEAILSRSKSTDAKATIKILQIIAMAKRPLSLQEMNVTLNLKANIGSYEELDLEDTEHLSHRIRDACGLLVSIIDSKVYIIHQTALKFLIYDDSIGHSPGKWKGSIDPIKSHLAFANICISYLLFDHFEKDPLEIAAGDSRDEIQTEVDQYTATNVFLSYAAEHWADHFREANIAHDTELLELAVKLCSSTSRRFLTWFRVYWFGLDINAPIPQGFTDLIIASYFGLHSVVKVLLSREKDYKSIIDTKDELGWTALHHSAYRGHESVVNLLLEIGASTIAEDDSGSTALHRAAESGQDAIALLLIEKYANVDAKDRNGDTALHVATYKGHPSVVKVLLDKGADFSSLSSWKKTPQQLATWLGEGASTEDLKERYNSVVGLVKDAVFASLGLTQGPLLPVDRKFHANIVYFPRDPQQNILRPMRQVFVNELIDGKIDLKIEKGSLMCKWFHLPANNVFLLSRSGMMLTIIDAMD
jgi:hypothetical protein